jgi:hypothetical protein
MRTYFILFGGIVLSGWTFILLDYVAHRHQRKAHKKP